MVGLMATKEFQWIGTVADPFIFFGMTIGGGIGTPQAQEVKAYLDENEQDDVNIILSSNGGDMFIATRIIDLLNGYKSRISVEMVGLVASAGTALAVSLGDKVYIRETTMAMIHAPTSFTEGTLQDHVNKVDFLQKAQSTHTNIYLNNTSLTREEIDAALSSERFFTAEEAITAGLSDELLEANEKVAEVMEQLSNDIEEDDDIFIIAAKYPIAKIAALYSSSISTEVYVDKELEKSLRAEIDALKDKVTSLEQSNTDLKAKLADKIKELNAQVNSAVVDKAISEKRIDAKERDTWLNRLNDSPKVVKEILESMEPAVLHSGEVGADKDKPNSNVSLEDVPEGIVSSYKEAGFSDEEILKAWRDSQ